MNNELHVSPGDNIFDAYLPSVKFPIRIISVGCASPSRVVASTALDAKLGYPPGTVERKSGVQERRFVEDSMLQSELAAAAVRDALERADIKISDVDLLISTTGVSEQALPSTACAIARWLEMKPGTPAFDVNASCLSFMAGLQVASSLLASRAYRRIVVVASDLASRGLDWDQPEASLIFGDGAAAVVVENSAYKGFRSFYLETYPVGFGHCEIRAGGTRRNPRVGVEAKDYLFRMDGKSVFKLASQVVPHLIDKALHSAAVGLDDIDVIVPHQASHLAMKHMIDRLGFCKDKVVDIYRTHGNQVSASMPTALFHAMNSGKAVPGKRLLLLGTAAGFTAGAAVLDL